MDEYISRKWISDAIHNFFCGLKHSVTEEDIQAYISATPIADVRENIHGHWIRHLRNDLGVKLNDCIECSECKTWFTTEEMIRRSFCPNCGADMREDQNE